MNRRSFAQTGLTVGVLAIAVPSVLLQTACGDTKQLVRWTTMLIGALKDVSPILGDMGAGSIVGLIARAIPLAERLKKAFEDNDHATTLQVLDNLINPNNGIIVQIANAVGALADDARKKIVLGLLAIGMVALHLIAANLSEEVPPSGAAVARSARPQAVSSIEKAAKSNSLKLAFDAAKF